MADVFSIRYSTKYFDPEMGFYYYGYRYYSPELMRGITRDSIGEEGGVNLYAFCENSPVDAFDGTGRGTHPAEWAFYGAFRGTAHREGDCFRCWESWSLGVKEREGSVNGRRLDASRIRHGETGRLAAPWRG